MQDVINSKLTFVKAFPVQVIKAMENINLEKIEEIRIRANCPVILKGRGE